MHWFLDGKDDVRSCYYLEDAATEFQVQGLELDWACVVWDADLRAAQPDWDTWEFKGSRWQRIRSPERRLHLKNAYRVLLGGHPVVLLDEPTEHLDEATADTVADELLRALQGRTVLWVAHRPHGLEQLDRLVRLDG